MHQKIWLAFMVGVLLLSSYAHAQEEDKREQSVQKAEAAKSKIRDYLRSAMEDQLVPGNVKPLQGIAEDVGQILALGIPTQEYGAEVTQKHVRKFEWRPVCERIPVTQFRRDGCGRCIRIVCYQSVCRWRCVQVFDNEEKYSGGRPTLEFLLNDINDAIKLSSSPIDPEVLLQTYSALDRLVETSSYYSLPNEGERRPVQ